MENNAWQTGEYLLIYASAWGAAGAGAEGGKKVEKRWKKFLTNREFCDRMLWFLARGTHKRNGLWKKSKNFEKSTWQNEEAVIECASCPMSDRKTWGRKSVPCKLNNAKTNKTPWTINGLFKFSWKRINSQRNSWVYLLEQITWKMILRASALEIQFFESLILAQDERWRRA